MSWARCRDSATWPVFLTPHFSANAPLALGLGDGSELMWPLAIAVVGGLSVSTLLTLFVVPCLYVLLHALTAKVRGFVLGSSESGHNSRPQPVAGD